MVDYDIEWAKQRTTQELIQLLGSVTAVLRERGQTPTQIMMGTTTMRDSFPDLPRAIPNYLQAPRDVETNKQPWYIIFVSPVHDHPLLAIELRGRATIGREDVTDIDLSLHDGIDMGISRRHAELRPDEEGIYLKDLGSTNGTYWNDQRLASGQMTQLKTDDVIRLGRLYLRVAYVSRAQRP